MSWQRRDGHQVIDDARCLQVPDANGLVCGSAQLVTCWAEDTRIDGVVIFSV